MADFSVVDKFDGKKGFTSVKFGADAPLLETELNEMQKIMQEARAEIIRSSTHSGFLKPAQGFTNGTGFDDLIHVGSTNGSIFSFSNTGTANNTLSLGYDANGNTVVTDEALINGYKIQLPRKTYAVLPDPPTFGYREDLVFLEAWFEEIDAVKDTSIKDTRIGVETSRRVKLNWRIRTVAGVDFSKYPDGLGIYPDGGTGQANVVAQGALASPTTSTNMLNSAFWKSGSFYTTGSKTSGTFRAQFESDMGLYVAGYGESSKATFGTADGYVYAIPMFRVKRRNSGGYRPDNVNGARDFIVSSVININAVNGVTTSYDVKIGTNYELTMADVPSLVKSGDELVTSSNTYFKIISVDIANKKVIAQRTATDSTLTLPVSSYWFKAISDRPDGTYSNIIDNNDIIDLRHQVSLTGFNYQQLLEQNFDKLLRGDLQTKDKITMKKERFGLTPAPLGLQTQLNPVTVKGTDGVFRDLTNLFGDRGTFKDLSGALTYGTPTNSIDTTWSVDGGTSAKSVATLSGSGLGLSAPLKAGKYYLLLANYRVLSGTMYFSVYDQVNAISYGTNQTVTDTNALYRKIAPTLDSSDVRFAFKENGSTPSTFNVDAVRLYEIDKATYDLIDIDANYTGDLLVGKFPYVNSYLNIIESKISPPTDMISPSAVITATDSTRVSVTTAGNVSVTVEGNELVVKNLRTDFFRYVYFDVSSLGVNLQPTDKLYFYDKNGVDQTSATGSSNPFTIDSVNVIMIKLGPSGTVRIAYASTGANAVSLPAPKGRWLTPYDGANGDTSFRMDSYFGGGRTVLSDAQATETITEVIESLRTPQRHIKVTQAVEGKWAVNDTIQVSSVDGVVMGVVDSDTALAKVVASSVSPFNTIYLDDVSKLAVNDTFMIYNADGTLWGNPRTVTAVDTTNKTVTVDTAYSASPNLGAYVVETTSSSSVPVTTATGLVGTWSGLGTKTAIFTVTTKPTTDTDPIKLQYSVVYPSGKGIQQVPYDVLEGKVNGEKLVKASDSIVRVKASFSGKVSGNTDLVPHVMRTLNSGVTGLPTSPTGSSVNEITNQSRYSYYSAVDGSLDTDSRTANGEQISRVFSFDIIRAITDKLGEGIFADCPTLADKVAKAKTIASLINFYWYGYGSGPSGNKAEVRAWRVDSSIWANANITHTNSTVTKLTVGISPSNAGSKPDNSIDSNGFIHLLALSDASDGVTASTLNTDYVELEIQLNVAETGYDVLVPDNQFPKLRDNILPDIQANPIDTNGYAAYSNATLSIDSLGVLKVVTGNTNLNEGFFTNPTDYPTAIPNKKYTFSVDLKGSGTLKLQIRQRDSSGVLLAGVQATQSSVIALSGGFTRYSLDVTTVSTCAKVSLEVFTDVMQNTTFYAKNLALKESDSKFSEGRKRKKNLNFLGKVAGSTFENPHRRLYASSTNLTNAPSTYTTEGTQSGYDNMSKLDGVLSSYTTAVTGAYAQNVYEFDLSHLGMSLSELKSAFRKFTVNWTGYGKGDSGLVTPTVAPTLGQSADAGSNLVAGTTYYVAYSWINASGETLMSPESSIVVSTAGNRIDITVPTLPTGATGFKKYVGTVSGQLKSASINGTVNGTVGQVLNLSAYTVAPPTENTANYGATLKTWNASGSGAWSTTVGGTNTGSSPSVVSYVSSDPAAPFFTKDQKVYVLVYSTYPASATYQSEVYTDYVNLVVELADYVDYLPATPVKVRKETKEVKLVYPMKSNRFGSNGDLELTYRFIPYQGKYDGNTINLDSIVSYLARAYAISSGTGKAQTGSYGTAIYYTPISTKLPINVSDSLLTGDQLIVTGQEAGADNFSGNTAKVTVYERAFDTYPGFVELKSGLGFQIGGAKGVRGGTVSKVLYNGVTQSFHNFFDMLSSAKPHLTVLPILASYQGQLYLVVLTSYKTDAKNSAVYIGSTTNTVAFDYFPLVGNPLVKGVN